MKTVLVTTRGNQFFEVFQRAYLAEGGAPFDLVIYLPERDDVGFRGLGKLVAGLALVGLGGAFDMLRLKIQKDFVWQLGGPEPAAALADQDQGAFCARELELATLDRKELREVLLEVQCDVLVSVGAPIILKAAELNAANIGCLNVHNGRVPRYRGHFSTFWELSNREQELWSSIHVMRPKVDEGPVLARVSLPRDKGRGLLRITWKKKELGGRALARLMNEVHREGSLPKRNHADPEDGARSEYFGFPKIADVVRWRLGLGGRRQ